jgi:hypothetical protein
VCAAQVTIAGSSALAETLLVHELACKVIVMAGYVYCGSCVEPGGFELEDDSYEDTCPQCESGRAIFRSWETNDGGCINLHWSVYCPDCGHQDCDPFAGEP